MLRSFRWAVPGEQFVWLEICWHFIGLSRASNKGIGFPRKTWYIEERQPARILPALVVLVSFLGLHGNFVRGKSSGARFKTITFVFDMFTFKPTAWACLLIRVSVWSPHNELRILRSTRFSPGHRFSEIGQHELHCSVAERCSAPIQWHS